VALTVHPDGSLGVQETLTFAFRGQHNGIYRTIPVRYIRHGADFALRLDEIHVLDENHQPLKTEVTYPGRAVRIKAWVPGAADASRTVHVLYRVRRGLLVTDDHDELYWNVTGDEWEVPIRRAEATVALPKGIDPAAVLTTAYTGPRGGTEREYEVERRAEGLAFRALRPLRPREGLTIVVGWPRGAITPTPWWREAWWRLVDNWPLTLPLLTLAAMGLVWRAYGRDPAVKRSIKPEYEPPAGILPAEAGALIDQKAEPSDVVATLVDLGVRGYLQVERVGDDDFLFRRLRPLAGDTTLAPLELAILLKVFGENLSLKERALSELRRDSRYIFEPLRDAVYRALVGHRLFAASPFWIRHAWGWVGFLLISVAVPVGVMLDGPQRVGWALPVAIGASGLIVFVFARIMPRRTWRGAKLLVHLRGFQEFLERAEKDRLARMPADTLHRWLPWAIALGVAEQWIHHFNAIPVDPPGWLRGNGFTLADYDRSVRSFGQHMGQALATGPRGGGSGGGSGDSGFSGGSSGGGSGGGGGGTF
jgi:uncharacterized membrane protein YgcG